VVNAVALSADGRLLATASDDNTARLFETTSGKELARLDDATRREPARRHRADAPL
jgi:WD40 repeat protein